jgi:hypothetical protein
MANREGWAGALSPRRRISSHRRAVCKNLASARLLAAVNFLTSINALRPGLALSGALPWSKNGTPSTACNSPQGGRRMLNLLRGVRRSFLSPRGRQPLARRFATRKRPAVGPILDPADPNSRLGPAGASDTRRADLLKTGPAASVFTLRPAASQSGRGLLRPRLGRDRRWSGY